MFQDIKLFSMLKYKMDYLAERQDVLSRSVANMDTPDFEMLDLKPQKVNQINSPAMRGIKVVATNPLHITGFGGDGGPAFKASEVRKPFETKPMGNNVSLEELMLKINDNSMEYQQAVNIYSKTSQLFKFALNSRG